MRVSNTVIIGCVLTVVGLVGLLYIFPNYLAVNGKEFVDQIDASGSSEKWNNYEIGDEVILVDEISRIEHDESRSQTKVWLVSIGKKSDDIYFIFESNIMKDYGVGSKVIITFEVVKDSVSGHYVPDGYQKQSSGEDGNGISKNGIKSYSVIHSYSTFEYICILVIVIGFATIGYGSGLITIKKDVSASEFDSLDDWGAAAPPIQSMPPQVPVTPPPIAPTPLDSAAAPITPPQPQYPPSTAAIPQQAPVSPPASDPSTMTITVPPGVVAGQVLTVTMLNGQVINVQVPAGSLPGSQFTITVKQ